MFYTPRSAFEMLTEVRPVVETPSKPLSKQMIQDLQLLGIRFLREPFNNPLMQNTENVMLSFPKKANESAAPGVLFFNVLCKTSYEHYDCSIDAKSDQIKLLKKTQHRYHGDVGFHTTERCGGYRELFKTRELWMDASEIKDRLNSIRSDIMLRNRMLACESRDFRMHSTSFTQEALQAMLQRRLQDSLLAKTEIDEVVDAIEHKNLQYRIQDRLDHSLRCKKTEHSRIVHTSKRLCDLNKVKHPGLRDALLFEQMLQDLDVLRVINQSRRNYETESDWKANVELIKSNELRAVLLKKLKLSFASKHPHLLPYDKSCYVIREIARIWPLMGHFESFACVDLHEIRNLDNTHLSITVSLPRPQKHNVNMKLSLHVDHDGTASLRLSRSDPPLLVDKVELWRPIRCRDTLSHLIRQDFRYYWFGSNELKRDTLVVREAIAQSAWTMELLPRALKKDLAFLKTMVTYNPEIVKFIDIRTCTEENWLSYIAIHPTTLAHLGKKVRTNVACAVLALNEIWARHYVPHRDYQCYRPVSLDFERAYKPIANVVHQTIRGDVVKGVVDTSFQHVLYKFWKLLPHECAWNDAWGLSSVEPI